MTVEQDPLTFRFPRPAEGLQNWYAGGQLVDDENVIAVVVLRNGALVLRRASLLPKLRQQ